MSSSVSSAQQSSLQDAIGAYAAAQGDQLLKNLSQKMLTKKRSLDEADIQKYMPFLIEVAQQAPCLDPSFGVLRSLASSFLLQVSAEAARCWDERVLADQMSAMLYNMRKVLRSPLLFNRAKESLKGLDDDFMMLLGLFEDSVCMAGSGEKIQMLCLEDLKLETICDEQAVLAIELADQGAPDMKVRFHKQMKAEKEAEQATKKRIKAIQEELDFLEEYLDLDAEVGFMRSGQAGPPLKRRRLGRGKKDHFCRKGPRSSRKYLPHRDLGEVQLTLARDKSYICYRRADGSGKYAHLLTVYSQGRFGTSKHNDLCKVLFEKVSQGCLNKAQAVALRETLIASFN